MGKNGTTLYQEVVLQDLKGIFPDRLECSRNKSAPEGEELQQLVLTKIEEHMSEQEVGTIDVVDSLKFPSEEELNGRTIEVAASPASLFEGDLDMEGVSPCSIEGFSGEELATDEEYTTEYCQALMQNHPLSW